MKTVTLDVRPPTEAMADFALAWKTGKGSKSDRISFATPELLWKVLTAKRWELLKALCGAGPVTVREAARRVVVMSRRFIQTCRPFYLPAY